MRKRYLIIALLLMLIPIINVKALKFGDCEVLISFKQSSSLDEYNYVCKGKEFGNVVDNIYYSGIGNVIRLNGLDAYYLSVYENIELSITGNNNISLLHVNSLKLNVSGSGSLKFKEGSVVKKLVAGENVYQYVYNGKAIINNDNQIYEGRIVEFENDYAMLTSKNNLPEVFNVDEYELVQVQDFTKMTSVVVTDTWLEKHIDTKLEKTVLDGYGIIKYVENKKEDSKKTNEEDNNKKTLESENVIFVSDKEVGNKYKLDVDDLNATDVAKDVSSQLEDSDLISFYDVNVYNGKKQVSMKDGKYTLKIKIDEETKDNYDNYQIIYVNDNGEIEEYLDGYIENGYIIFNTSHLSQYGVIAKEKIEPVMVEVNTPINYKNILKVSILLLIIVVYFVLLSILIIKGKLIKKRKLRK